jgi:hypothetical protein
LAGPYRTVLAINLGRCAKNLPQGQTTPAQLTIDGTPQVRSEDVINSTFMPNVAEPVAIRVSPPPSQGLLDVPRQNSDLLVEQ